MISQQIIQRFKLNHGLFLDGCSIEPSKQAVFTEDGELSMSLYEGKPLVYTFINDRNSHVNLLRFNSDDNSIKLHESLQPSDICIDFPVAKITYTANLLESFLNFMNDDVETLYETYGHLFAKKFLIGGKLFIINFKSATSTEIDLFKSLLIWAYESAKYNKENPFSNLSILKFFPKITTLDGEKLDTLSKLTNWLDNLYQRNMADIIFYNDLIPISELRSNTSSSVDEKQPGIANYKEKLSLEEWVKDLTCIKLTKWIKELHLLHGLIINKRYELENSRKIAISFIDVPSVHSSDKLYLETINPTTTLDEFLNSNADDVNKFLDKDSITLLPFVEKSIKYVSYGDYKHLLAKYEQCRILLSKEIIKPSEEFKQAIEKALENMKPLICLQYVFNEYGYFFPLNIILGKSLKNILPNSSSNIPKKVDLGTSSSSDSLKSHLDNLNIPYLLTKKGSVIEKSNLSNWFQNIRDTNNLEIIKFDNIISLYDILEVEQKRRIDVVLNRKNDFKIIMTGIDDLKDLDINNTDHYKRINIKPSLEDENYEVFGSVISKNNLKSKDFFVKFGLYDINGFSAIIKSLKNTDITKYNVLWMIIGNPLKLSVFSPRNRELQVNYIKESITLTNDNHDPCCSIKTSYQLSQGDTVSVNIYCSTNYEPINAKLSGWSKNRLDFQILKSIYNNPNLNTSNSSIISSDSDDDGTDSSTNTESAAIAIDIYLCILSSEYKNLNIDNKEKCHLDLIGYTLTEENFIREGGWFKFVIYLNLVSNF